MEYENAAQSMADQDMYDVMVQTWEDAGYTREDALRLADCEWMGTGHCALTDGTVIRIEA